MSTGLSIRTALADYIEARRQTTSWDTLVFERLPNDLQQGMRLDGSTLVVDVAGWKPGDETGRGVVRLNTLGGGNPSNQEHGAANRVYTFTLWLYKDARYFTANDVADELEEYLMALAELQTVDGPDTMRADNPDVTFVSPEPTEYGEHSAYFGTLVVGYVAFDTVEEE